MALRIYMAGSAQSDHGDNWRSTIVGDACWTRGDMLNMRYLYPDELITENALPGGFDYIGAYIESKGHCAWGLEREFAHLHALCLVQCDVLWVWMAEAGQGTDVEIGFATAYLKPVVLAYPYDEPDAEQEFSTFTEEFAHIKKPIYASTAREAWDKFAANPIKYMHYSQYLKTDHWQRVRGAVYEQSPKLCARCGSAHHVQLHHLTYERVGREAWGDLMPLCEVCHQAEHSLRGD